MFLGFPTSYIKINRAVILLVSYNFLCLDISENEGSAVRCCETHGVMNACLPLCDANVYIKPRNNIVRECKNLMQTIFECINNNTGIFNHCYAMKPKL